MRVVNVVDAMQTHCHCGWALPKVPLPVDPKPGEKLTSLIVAGVSVVIGCPQCDCAHVFRPFSAADLRARRADAEAVH